MGPFTHAAAVNEAIMRHIAANEPRLSAREMPVRAAA